MKLRPTLLATALFLVFGQAAAQPNTPAAESFSSEEKERAVTTARLLIQRQLPSVACDILARTHGTDTQSPDALYLLAHCSRMLGETETAIAYYQRLTVLLPNAPRPKAELAAIYTAQGRREEARNLYRQAASLQQGTEAAILFQHLAGTDAAENPARAVSGPKRWQIDLYGGFTLDSNINAGPVSANVAAIIGGVPVTLIMDDASMPQEKTGYNVSAGGRYLVPLSNEWAILYQGSLSASDYFNTDAYNSESLAAGAAFIYQQPTYNISIQPNLRYVRQDDHLQERTVGLNARATRTLSRTLEVFGTLGYFDRDVPVADYRSGDGYRASAGLNHALSNGIQVGGEYMVQREDLKLASEARDLHGPSFYAAFAPMPRVDLMASYGYTMTQHDERQALFPDVREDRQHRAGLSLAYKVARVTSGDVRLVAEYNYFRNKSTVGVNDYLRRVLSVGVQARF